MGKLKCFITVFHWSSFKSFFKFACLSIDNLFLTCVDNVNVLSSSCNVTWCLPLTREYGCSGKEIVGALVSIMLIFTDLANI